MVSDIPRCIVPARVVAGASSSHLETMRSAAWKSGVQLAFAIYQQLVQHLQY